MHDSDDAPVRRPAQAIDFAEVPNFGEPQWVGAGLGVVTTNLCAVTRDLADRDLIDTFAPGDAPGLAARLIAAVDRNDAERRERTERARDYLIEAYRPETLFTPLAAWARAPERAPDLSEPGDAPAGVPFAISDNALARRRAKEWRDARQNSPSRTRHFLKRLVGRD